MEIYINEMDCYFELHPTHQLFSVLFKALFRLGYIIDKLLECLWSVGLVHKVRNICNQVRKSIYFVRGVDHACIYCR
jgi:hypothetical protein